MKPNAALEGFVAESLAAEQGGEFAPYLERTRAAAHSLVRRLLSGVDVEESAPRHPHSLRDGDKSASPSGGALLGFLAQVAAPFLSGGAAAAIAPLASAATGAAGAVASPLGVLAAAVAGAIGGDDAAGGSESTGSGATPTALRATAPAKKNVTLRFRSAVEEQDKRWQANLCIPVVGNGPIVVRLVTPRQATGTFHFCGISIPIAKGCGEIPLSALRAGLSRGGVAFARPGATPVPGAPFLEV